MWDNVRQGHGALIRVVILGAGNRFSPARRRSYHAPIPPRMQAHSAEFIALQRAISPVYDQGRCSRARGTPELKPVPERYQFLSSLLARAYQAHPVSGKT